MRKSMATVFLLVVFCQSILFAKTDPNIPASSQNELDAQLLKAIEALDVNGVQIALKNGANPNWASNTKKGKLSALRTTVKGVYRHKDKIKSKQNILIILKLLFNTGAKLQLYDSLILFTPIAHNCPKVVEYLIQKGASPTNKMEGMRPIEWAAHYESDEACNILIKYGAEPLTKKKKSLYHFIHLAGSAYTKDIPKMNMLLDDGFNINNENSRGEGAITEAAGFAWYDAGRYLMIMYLIDKHVDINHSYKVDGINQTALHAAVYGTHFALSWDISKCTNEESKERTKTQQFFCKKVLKELIHAGAHVSARDEYARTPLHIAAKYNNIIAAKMLIEANAKLMDKDNKGQTPLDYAESGEMIKILKDAGAKEIP